MSAAQEIMAAALKEAQQAEAAMLAEARDLADLLADDYDDVHSGTAGRYRRARAVARDAWQRFRDEAARWALDEAKAAFAAARDVAIDELRNGSVLGTGKALIPESELQAIAEACVLPESAAKG